jgi:AcrR family transcriptional regulator
MVIVSTQYELVGRTGQKRRTRDALVAAARDLVAEGMTPTVEQAAEAAAVSRATAYRYFPNQRALLVAAHPETEANSLLPPDAPEDPEARLDLVVEAFTRLIADTDAQQRTMLRLSLEPDGAAPSAGLLRQGRAIGWIDEALAPLRERMSDSEVRRLVLAIRSATGIEARIWLTDVAGLTSDEANDLMRWSAKALYRSALADTVPADRGKR